MTKGNWSTTSAVEPRFVARRSSTCWTPPRKYSLKWLAAVGGRPADSPFAGAGNRSVEVKANVHSGCRDPSRIAIEPGDADLDRMVFEREPHVQMSRGPCHPPSLADQEAL